MENITIIHDLKDSKDSLGRSFKEVNMKKTHNITMGSLVECHNGVRLFVVSLDRDCDGTPLYSLCADKNDTVRYSEGFGNTGWDRGYSEGSLKVINLNMPI